MFKENGALVLLLALVGCHPARSTKPMEVTDSAGVVIVTNQGLDGVRIDSLSLQLIGIGTANGKPEYQFYHVSDGMVLHDGRIAVLNEGTQQLRFYDDNGRFLSSQGGKGQGPGEYLAPSRVLPLAGDSLLVYDMGLVRFTVIDPSGREARTFAPPQQVLVNAPELAGLIGDSIAVSHETLWRIPQVGFDTVYTRVAFIRMDGTAPDSLILPDGRVGRIGPAGQGLAGRPLFGPSTSFAADGHGLWAGLGTWPQVSRYDVHGRLERIVRWQAPRVSVTREDIERRINKIVAGAGERAAEMRTWFQGAPAAETFPFYDQLYVDRQRRLWVRTYDVTGEASERLWFVFGQDGRALGRVRLPSALRLLQVDGDSVLAVHTDDMGIEQVQLWKLDHGFQEG